MVFKPFTHLARHSFAKAAPHGYAQSLVAGAQGSYASSTTGLGPFTNHPSTRFSKPGSTQFHNAFQYCTVSSNSNIKASISSTTETGQDRALEAYFAAWNKHVIAGALKDWKQYQFQKRIEWKTPTASFDGKAKEKRIDGDHGLLVPERAPDQGMPDRVQSASVVEDLKKSNVQDEVARLAAINKAIAQEIADMQSEQTRASSDVDKSVNQIIDAANNSTSPSAVTRSLSVSSYDDTTTPTSLVSQDSIAMVERIASLNKAQNYAEIPPVFESLLQLNSRPPTEAYNSLLQAAIHLPVLDEQVFAKALDVYTDMLRRNVLPDASTYDSLLSVHALSSIKQSQSKALLETSRARYGDGQTALNFILPSQLAKYEMIAEDKTLSSALRIFEFSLSSGQEYVLSAKTYELLITACAAKGDLDSMIRIYSEMERSKVVPLATVFAPMIAALASSGDLKSAVECYNEYKALAIADDSGKDVIVDRTDKEIYAAVIKGYVRCDRMAGAQGFFDKITKSFISLSDTEKIRLEGIQNHIVLNALVQGAIESGDFQNALNITTDSKLTPFMDSKTKLQALARICIAAADQSQVALASQAFKQLPLDSEVASTVLPAMLGMSLREKNLEKARVTWNLILNSSCSGQALIEPTLCYALALVESGFEDEALIQLRGWFARSRGMVNGPELAEIKDQIDECINVLHNRILRVRALPPASVNIHLLWAMFENGSMQLPVVEYVLASIGPVDVANLSVDDLQLALQAQSRTIIARDGNVDVAHFARFADLLQAAVSNRVQITSDLSALVEGAFKYVAHQRPDLIAIWQAYLRPVPQEAFTPAMTPQISRVGSVRPSHDDAFDPYASSTDFRGSTLISEDLERQDRSATANLNEALIRFRNMRRVGRHPRYITYGKLISAAARDGRSSFIHELLSMARHDMPYNPTYRAIRHGWASILDAMTGACLTLGQRPLAEQFHQELLEMGAAPTANTFGLYITTLKESTRTFDEATEAVRIFHRAKTEGVEPTSFLYNALIGKLGKARRIDDTLVYFNEMRARGIRPTSVTYGTLVNALTRVSDQRMAEDFFDEMEAMPNYRPRAAPYNCVIQFFLTTKRDSAKVLQYYHRMVNRRIQPTAHTYKLLIDTYATLSPIDMTAAEAVLDTIRLAGQKPEAVHYASLIHAKGCVAHDIAGARALFDSVLAAREVKPQACLYQALFEAMVANHVVKETEPVLEDMAARGVEMTAYISNQLIHGWTAEGDLTTAVKVYEGLGYNKREPSTYEAMARGYLAVGDAEGAQGVVREMLGKNFPSAVNTKVLELVGGNGGA